MADVHSGEPVSTDPKAAESTSRPCFMLRPSAFTSRSEASSAVTSDIPVIPPAANVFASKAATESDDDRTPGNESEGPVMTATPGRLQLRPSLLDKQASNLCRDANSLSTAPFRSTGTAFKLEPAKLCSPLSSKFADNNKASGEVASRHASTGAASSSIEPATVSNEATSLSSDSASTSSGAILFGKKIESPAGEVTISTDVGNEPKPVLPPSSSSTPAFIFGSNLADRVLVTPAARADATGGGEADCHNVESSPAAAEGSSDDVASPPLQAAHSLAESAALQSAAKQTHVELKEVEVVTGEEGESNVFQVNARLFVFDNETRNWIERGTGQLRLNDRQTASGMFQSRLVMRLTGSMRVVLNSMIWPGMLVERAQTKTIKISAVDSEDGHSIKIYSIQAHLNDAENIYNAIHSRVQNLRVCETTRKPSAASSVPAQSPAVACSSSCSVTTTAGASNMHNSSVDKRPSDTDVGSEVDEKRRKIDQDQRRNPTVAGDDSTDSSAIDPETEASNEGYSSSPVVRSTSPSSDA